MNLHNNPCYEYEPHLFCWVRLSNYKINLKQTGTGIYASIYGTYFISMKKMMLRSLITSSGRIEQSRKICEGPDIGFLRDRNCSTLDKVLLLFSFWFGCNTDMARWQCPLCYVIKLYKIEIVPGIRCFVIASINKENIL